MIEFLKSEGKAIGIKVNGKLVHADYEKFVPMLEEIIEKHGSFRCYCEMADFAGMSAHAVWDEIKFDIKHCGQIERCAVVGEKHSHEWMTKVGNMFFPKATMKYFDVSEKDAAWAWTVEGLAAEGSCGCGCSE